MVLEIRVRLDVPGPVYQVAPRTATTLTERRHTTRSGMQQLMRRASLLAPVGRCTDGAVAMHWAMSKRPTGGGAGVGKVGAIRAGADRAVEVLAESGVVFTDPGYRLAERTGDTDSSALGRGCGSSIAAAEADRARQLSHEEVAFGVSLGGALGVPECPRLLHVVFDLREASAVGGFGAIVRSSPASPRPV